MRDARTLTNLKTGIVLVETADWARLIAVCSCRFYFNSVIVQTAGQILTSNIAKKRVSARISLFRVVEQRTNQCVKLVSL